MKQFDGLQSLQQPLSGLPQWVSERILQQINQLNRIPGGVVWALAFAPFIGYALELWTAGLNGMSFDEAYEAVSGGAVLVHHAAAQYRTGVPASL